MNREVQLKLQWIKIYEECADAGLGSQSKSPLSSPDAKVTDELEMREKCDLGAQCLQAELILLHKLHIIVAKNIALTEKANPEVRL